MEHSAYGLIYSITHKKSGKCYIGQHIGMDVEDTRWKAHTYPSSGCTYIRNAIQKHGKHNFDFKVITYSSGGQWLLDLLEIHYIVDYKSLAPNGYNLRTGGKNGLVHENTKKKISISNSGEKNRNYGVPHTDEWKANMSGENHPQYGKRGELSHNYGRKASDECRAKISNANKGKTHTDKSKAKIRVSKLGTKNPMYGNTHTDEARMKISKANKGKVISDETKKKMSLAQSGANNPNYGKHHSDETKAKLSAAISGEKHYLFGKTKEEHPMYGKPRSIETKARISAAKSGFHHPNAYIGLKAFRFMAKVF